MNTSVSLVATFLVLNSPLTPAARFLGAAGNWLGVQFGGGSLMPAQSGSDGQLALSMQTPSVALQTSVPGIGLMGAPLPPPPSACWPAPPVTQAGIVAAAIIARI